MVSSYGEVYSDGFGLPLNGSGIVLTKYLPLGSRRCHLEGKGCLTGVVSFINREIELVICNSFPQPMTTISRRQTERKGPQGIYLTRSNFIILSSSQDSWFRLVLACQQRGTLTWYPVMRTYSVFVTLPNPIKIKAFTYIFKIKIRKIFTWGNGDPRPL